jgi:2-succinyl-5-enolpyruvyl-6-hydroxy-3-cyclohexene-1-carboxylate synthase
MMDMPANAMYAFVGAFVDELARSGVAHVCICPGSRSTPLAIVFARQPRIRVWMHLDERSAAFFALGLAKSSGMPVAVVCTSGTAAANFMPAVVEAKQARVPLIALTADRPHELRECGAAQTIDQIRIYGSQVKWSLEMPLPEASDTLLRFARVSAARAVATALEDPAGPVHCNFPFREPLVPTEDAIPPVSAVARHGRDGDRIYVRWPGATSPVQPDHAAPDRDTGSSLVGDSTDHGADGARHATQAPPVDGPALSEPAAARYAGNFAQARRGLIVCGPMEPREQCAEAIVELARALGYPVLADPLSGLRHGPHDRSFVVDAYDAFLRDEQFVRSAAPRMVLRFGAMPTAKPLLQYLQRFPQAHTLLIDRAGWRDPTLLAAEVIHVDPARFCRQLAARSTAPAGAAWLTLWREANRRSHDALAVELAGIDEPFEGRAMAELADMLPDGATLVAGNSMPVRDIDTFFHGGERNIRIVGNRGASGIDGVTSTALGIAAQRAGPVVLAIGDISFYHDMNGLLAAKQHGLNLTVVVLNNDGGGIFSFLPQADLPADERGNPFELLFGTPHGLDFAQAAALYDATYTRIGTWDAYRHAVRLGIETGGLHIVEVPTERARNVQLHRRLWPAVSAAIKGVVE